jgi:diguanylate cyclase (GGDEF)-like protein
MLERRSSERGRTLLGGQIIFNSGRSTIDCTVRNLSESGASLDVASPLGIPPRFHLIIAGESEPRECRQAWQSGKRLGVSFVALRSEEPEEPEDAINNQPTRQPNDLMRGEMLALRAALDEVRFGVVLLDSELRAQFINRAFRKMWRLPDAKADSKPAFVALMYHGRDTRAYEMHPSDVDVYIAERVALVKAGGPTPLDLRQANGEVIRLQCAVLPNGGRMLSYAYVTDIVRRSDELDVLHAALDRVQEGIILLDSDLNAQFMNRAVRALWKVSDEQAEQRPPYSELVGDARRTGTYGVAPEQLESFIATRIALVRAGDPTPRDLRTSDGRHIRSQCAVLPNGGRMLTYTDVTDLIRHGEKLEKLATVDSLTSVWNRRHFLALAEAEWSRFQRYHRPLTVLMLDIDHFKSINDRFGHANGDAALIDVANRCADGRRDSDIVGRIGGEEFAVMLPETDFAQSLIVAERIRQSVESHHITINNDNITLTVSIGVASATASMSGVDALMRASDQALYEAKSQGRNRVAHFTAASLVEPKLAAEYQEQRAFDRRVR